MNSARRPPIVVIVACVYLTVGVAGFALHFPELLAVHASQCDGLWIELTEFLAVLAGAFLLRRRNWARWLALAWIAFHVILSVFHPFTEFAVHCVFFAVIAWALFRPESARYFRGGGELFTSGKEKSSP
jgi:hypothetical protein